VQILSAASPELVTRMKSYREKMELEVAEKDAALQQRLV
jgi:phosphoribosylcarboxyaminoimidazole (NCAIR) mutase